MSNEAQSFEKTETYQIIVKGILDEKWSDWFEGFQITHQGENETLLIGQVSDQSALHGLLAKIRDLGLSLRSVECLPTKKSRSIQTKVQSRREKSG
jgi:hypothetical protein